MPLSALNVTTVTRKLIRYIEGHKLTLVRFTENVEAEMHRALLSPSLACTRDHAFTALNYLT